MRYLFLVLLLCGCSSEAPNRVWCPAHTESLEMAVDGIGFITKRELENPTAQLADELFGRLPVETPIKPEPATEPLPPPVVEPVVEQELPRVVMFFQPGVECGPCNLASKAKGLPFWLEKRPAPQWVYDRIAAEIKAGKDAGFPVFHWKGTDGFKVWLYGWQRERLIEQWKATTGN